MSVADRLLQNKPFGIRMGRSVEVSVFSKVLIRDYLLLPVTTKTIDPVSKKETVKTEHFFKYYNVVGAKGDIERFFEYCTSHVIYLPEPKVMNYQSGLHDVYSVQPIQFRNAGDQRQNGFCASSWHNVKGTVVFDHARWDSEIMDTVADEKEIKTYMLGVTYEDAEQGFPRFFEASVVPLLPHDWEPTWTPLLIKEVMAQDGWVTKLIGHQTVGYYVNVPTAELMALVQNLVMEYKLLYSPETLKRYKICPAAFTMDFSTGKIVPPQHVYKHYGICPALVSMTTGLKIPKRAKKVRR
jgi:hypothetical protein